MTIVKYICRVLVASIIWTLFTTDQAAAKQGVLDIGVCGKASRTEQSNTSLASSSIRKTSDSRSVVECVLNCVRSSPFDCTRAFRNGISGKCYELNGTAAELQSNSTVDVSMKGDFIELMSVEERDNCNGRRCRDEEMCIKSCGQEATSICVGDQKGKCGFSREYNYWRQYWVDVVVDDNNNGIIMSVTYPKRKAETGLRVIIHMAGRIAVTQQHGCAHWYVTFDGEKCKRPSTIEMLTYSYSNGAYHHTMDIDGTCYGLNAGDRKVELAIGPCDGYSAVRCQSSWQTSRTMLITEITPHQLNEGNNASYCPLLNVFNYQYKTWNEEVDETLDLTQRGRLVKSIPYEKFASDTSLRIKYSAVAAVVISDPASDVLCGRWYIKLDGHECSPQLDFILSPKSPKRYTYWKDNRQTRTLEGICDNELSAGTHSVEVWIGSCVGFDNRELTRMVTGGFNSASRLHVEEVRRDHPVDGVRSNSGMYRSHSANLYGNQWWQKNVNVDGSGDVFSVTYTKVYRDTGLRMTASGSHRIKALNPDQKQSSAAKWYFTIDGEECNNPGKINGVMRLNQDSDFHVPMQVDGICHGITRGSHTITYVVDSFRAIEPANTHMGYASSFHIFIEELRVDLVKICHGKYHETVNCDL